MKYIYQNTYLNLINQWNEKIIYQSRKENYKLQLKKLNLSQTQLNNLLNLILSFNNTKKQLMAIKWLKNGSIILPEDEYKLDEALKLAQKYKLDYQQFSSPMQLINSVTNKEQKYQLEHNIINPDDIPQFSHKVEHGDGIVTYWVNGSKAGQRAVRKMIDQYWGYDTNPWCLAARKDGIIRANQAIINNMTQKQKQKLGLYDDDTLATAFNYWNQYNAYPKRIAFKNNKLYAFSANNQYNNQYDIIWWDRNDKAFNGFPQSNIKDNDTLYYKLLLLKNFNISSISTNEDLSIQLIKELFNYYYQHQNIRVAIARRNDLPLQIIKQLVNDQSEYVRSAIAKNKILPTQFVKQLAKDKSIHVKHAIASREDLPIQLIRQLANNKNIYIKLGIANRKNLPNQLIIQLANDKNSDVRQAIAKNENIPIQLIKQLANDKSVYVRHAIASREDLPIQLIRQFANDQQEYVRQAILKRK